MSARRQRQMCIRDRNLGEEVEIWNYEKLTETNRVAKLIKQKIQS